MLRLCVWLERQCHDGKTESGPAGREGGREVSLGRCRDGWGVGGGGILFACMCLPVHMCEPTSVSTQLCGLGLFGRDIVPVLHHWGGGENLANFCCCVICDPKSQNVGIIERPRIRLIIAAKNVWARRRIAAARLSFRTRPASPVETCGVFLGAGDGGKLNEPQTDEPAEDHLA